MVLRSTQSDLPTSRPLPAPRVEPETGPETAPESGPAETMPEWSPGFRSLIVGFVSGFCLVILLLVLERRIHEEPPTIARARQEAPADAVQSGALYERAPASERDRAASDDE